METLLGMPKERRPKTLWKWIEFPYNEHQTDKARELSKELGFDRFEARRSTRWMPYPKPRDIDNIEQYLFPEELQMWRDKHE